MKTITICNQQDPAFQQLIVEVYPKDNHYKFDIIRLKLRDIDGNVKTIDMTPDEACEISGLLNYGVCWFLNTNKEHRSWLKKEKRVKGKTLIIYEKEGAEKDLAKRQKKIIQKNLH